MKLFQFDKKVWDDGDTSHTWQFGIIKNKSLLWVNYETPSKMIHCSGGLHILLGLFTSSSLFEIDFQQHKFSLGISFFTEYFDGWE
jgi:hypothetical protein